MTKQLSRRAVFITGIMAFISLGGYLLASSMVFRIGFPLDDAWIHQTYARNLATFGEWSFIPGVPSGGSTAPIWSGLLALGDLLKLGPYIWTFLLGWIALWGTALLAEIGFRSRFPDYAKFPWVGAFFALEWHLVWAAGSGMETLLLGSITLAVFVALLTGWRKWFLLGLATGVAVWVRPDGITIIGPICMTLLLASETFQKKVRGAGLVGSGFLAGFLPYLAFNRVMAGSWWPNTFYAKQSEYAILLNQPLFQRLGNEFTLPLIGVGFILLPGLIYAVWKMVKARDWAACASILWAFGYISLYAWRLPVTYQHGRYVIPAMPIIFLWGVIGFAWFARRKITTRLAWIVQKAWLFSTALVLVGFWFFGAQAYAKDVAIIETEMVDTARWVADHTQAGSLIAAHDIGALGYYGKRPILDLAGLISPEVIPIIRNETALKAYLTERNVNYLMTFPDWYTTLAQNLEPIYTGSGAFAPEQGQANMRVYTWKP